MKLRLAKSAARQAARIDAWWAEHRTSAPTLFAVELADTFRYILATPGAGNAWPTTRRPELRRVLMPKTAHHVYFRVDPQRDVLHVLAIWGAPRGRGPRL